MHKCTGRRDITEILLKTALKTIQSIKFKIRFNIFAKSIDTNQPALTALAALSRNFSLPSVSLHVTGSLDFMN